MPDWGSTYVAVDLSEQHMWYDMLEVGTPVVIHY